MKHVSLADARANIAKLLDEVERGETVTISREGVSKTELEPPFDEERREAARQAIEGIRAFRSSAARATIDEIIAWKNEGRE
ncbi:type II toxin-antitoxin system Phd/YefM family antitoxin [Rhodopseudomonas parapalustris]